MTHGDQGSTAQRGYRQGTRNCGTARLSAQGHQNGHAPVTAGREMTRLLLPRPGRAHRAGKGNYRPAIRRCGCVSAPFASVAPSTVPDHTSLNPDFMLSDWELVFSRLIPAAMNLLRTKVADPDKASHPNMNMVTAILYISCDPAPIYQSFYAGKVFILCTQHYCKTP